MEFVSELLKPSAFHQQNLDVLAKDEKHFEWKCDDCASIVSVGLNERLKFTFGGFAEGQFTKSDVHDVRQFYAMGEHSRSPCGEALSFEVISCPECGRPYLFSYGIQETSNSFLILTVQGVVKINRAQQDGALRP